MNETKLQKYYDIYQELEELNLVQKSRFKKILIVEDCYATLSLILKMLNKNSDFWAVGYSDEVMAIENFHRDMPDLLITDFHLPSMDGKRLSECLNLMSIVKIPTIFISSDKRIKDYLDSNNDMFLEKPVSSKRLINCIEKQMC